MATIQLLPAEGELLELDPNSGAVVLPPATQETTADFIDEGTQSVVDLPTSEPELNALKDVDVSDLNDGSVLVYKTQTSKWTSTLTLEQQYMNGGFF